MKTSLLILAAAITSWIVVSAQTDARPTDEQKVIQLEEPYLEKTAWKDAGFKTPQATGQTFMWAMREGDWKKIRSCFASPDDVDDEPSEEDIEKMEKARERAKGFQALAFKGLNDGTVELKFRVSGWQEEPLVHRLKKVDGEWKLFGSTRDAGW